MTIPSIHSAAHPQQPAELPRKPEDAAKAAQQFENILVRQILSESMKPLLEGGPSGQFYGYMLTDSLADSIGKAGGLGLCSILQSQLGTDSTHAKP
jgi:Rod binding domain-containing protein